MSLSRVNPILLIALSCINGTLIWGFPILKFQKYHVIVYNGLQPSGNNLGVHCKSKDNDLGFHQLHLNQQYQFHFRTSVFENTLFFCRLSWSKGKKVFVAFQDDDGFVDLGCGGRHCTWKAQEDGIYLFNLQHNQFKLVYQWGRRD